MNKLFFASFLSVIALYSCQKQNDITPVPPPADSLVISPPTPIVDSANVLIELRTSEGGRTQFIYDSKHKRYNGFVSDYVNYYDSTLVNYNDDGSIANTINKQGKFGGQNLTINVVENNMDKLPWRIYNKIKIDSQKLTRAYLSSINLDHDIAYYDSINYDDKKRVQSVYTIYRGHMWDGRFIRYYRNFFYDSIQERTLSAIESFELKADSTFHLNEKFVLLGHDGKINPTFRNLSWYGFFSYVTFFLLHPEYSANEARFLTMSEQNCNRFSVKNYGDPDTRFKNVYYTYDSTGLPLRASFGGEFFPEAVDYKYKKLPK